MEKAEEGEWVGGGERGGRGISWNFVPPTHLVYGKSVTTFIYLFTDLAIRV